MRAKRKREDGGARGAFLLRRRVGQRSQKVIGEGRAKSRLVTSPRGVGGVYRGVQSHKRQQGQVRAQWN
jgi:hypothetical protein